MAVKVTDIDGVERTLPEVKEVGQRIEKRVGDEEKRAVQAEEALRTSLSEHEKAAEESFEEVNFALQAEIDRAKSAEQNLNTAIQNESERAQGAESSLKSSIEEEKNRATSAESALQESINTEVSRAKEAEEVLGQEISSEADRAKGEESRIEGLLRDEVSRAQEAESVLAQDIEEEKNRAEQVEASLTSAISQEQEQRILGDTTLDSKINKEIQDRQSGDSQNSQAIQAEATRAQEAESALQADIDAEESRATQVEGQLSTRITSIEEKIPNQASSTNQLADKAFVNSSIQQMAANRVTYDAQGSPFPTRATLLSSQTYYHDGVAYTPDEHDYALVTADEGAPTPFTGGQTRFEWTGSGWEYAYGINERPLTSEEWAAIESGITAEKVAEIGTKLPINNTTNSLYGTDSGGSQVMVPRSSFATSAQGQKADTAYQKPEGGIPKTDLDSSVQGSLNKADTAYQKPTGGITESDLSQSVNDSLDKADSAYQKPSSGIPKLDLASDVQESLDSADSAYHKPEGGITESDLSSSVNVSLDKADTAYQKPSAGIPKSDLDMAVQEVLTTAEGEPALRQAADTALGERIDDILDGTTPPQKVVGSYEQLEDGTYNLIIGLTGDAPSAAAITQINGEDLAGKEFYEYVRTEGAVLFSFNPDFSPAARYGGSWENITDRFLIGAGGSYTLGSTGGEANVTLTVDEIPPHDHVPNVYNIEMDAPSGELVVAPAKVNARHNIEGYPTQNAGGGQPHNNLPPYIAVNIWRKVA